MMGRRGGGNSRHTSAATIATKASKAASVTPSETPVRTVTIRAAPENKAHSARTIVSVRSVGRIAAGVRPYGPAPWFLSRDDEHRALMLLPEIERRVIACRRCPELRAYCGRVAREKKRAYKDWKYWGKPVPAFGDPRARVMLVGLAPGAHGSNRTGRAFTGDASGAFLYPALYRAGFASQPNVSDRNDGQRLHDCIITAAARCAPPHNKPTPQELRNCSHFLLDEFDALPHLKVMVGL